MANDWMEKPFHWHQHRMSNIYCVVRRNHTITLTYTRIFQMCAWWHVNGVKLLFRAITSQISFPLNPIRLKAKSLGYNDRCIVVLLLIFIESTNKKIESIHLVYTSLLNTTKPTKWKKKNVRSVLKPIEQVQLVLSTKNTSTPKVPTTQLTH